MIRKLLCTASLLTMLFVGLAHTQLKFDGHWEGAITIMGSKLMIAVDVDRKGDTLHATIDIPQQNAKGLALKNVSVVLPRVHFELPAGPGLAVFDGIFAGDSIAGDFTQSGIKGTFSLRQGTKEQSVEPVEIPPAYKNEEVKITNGAVTLAGTLSLPKPPGKYPAIVFMTGSGSQNRDEEVFGFKPFKILADYLTRVGIAVLRCDDRGVGGSTGPVADATSVDFAGDVEAMVNYLRSRPDIEVKKIGLLGHSEGGLVASMVAARSKNIAFLVLMASPGVTGAKIISKQIEMFARAGGASEDEIKKALALQQFVYQVVRTDKGWDSLRIALQDEAKESLNKLTPEERKAFTDSSVVIEKSVEAKMQGAKTPWFKYFIDADPAVQLEKIHCPVLALFGELDMQVPPDLNRGAMEAALRKAKNGSSSVGMIPKANHLFQEAVTGNVSEYATLKKEFVPGFLEEVTGWILKRVK